MENPLSDNKKIWKVHCEMYYVPLYFRPWWMDCVCGQDGWDVCLSLDGRGRVEAALVFHSSSYLGCQVIKMPPLTTYSGLWIHHHEPLTKQSSRIAYEKKVFQKLISQLPNHVLFYQQWHPDILNWLPFYWHGFKQATHYTYRLENLNLKAGIFKEMKRSARTDIRNASQHVTLQIIEKPDILFRLYTKSFGRQNKNSPLDFSVLNKLYDEIRQQNLGTLLVAQDKNGNVHAGVLLVWDEKCTYFLMSGGDDNYRWSKAMYYLFWQAIELNPGNSQVFDFEGSMLEPVERFIRSFGGILTPHFKITKASNKFFQLASLLLGKEYH